jgi:hypothetical protein
MRGKPYYNFPAFDAAKHDLEAAGWHVISPADIDRLFEGWPLYPPEGIEFHGDAYSRFIRRDIECLLSMTPEVDAIYLLNGWEASKGANVELAVAKFRGLRTYFQEEGVPEP